VQRCKVQGLGGKVHGVACSVWGESIVEVKVGVVGQQEGSLSTPSRKQGDFRLLTAGFRLSTIYTP